MVFSCEPLEIRLTNSLSISKLGRNDQKRACIPDRGSKESYAKPTSHPPQRRISGGLVQIPSQEGMSSK